eukprot:53389_1
MLMLFDIKCMQLYYYCRHILPFINISETIDTNKFKDITQMIQDIEIIYHIIFECIENNKQLRNICVEKDIYSDIPNIIIQYLSHQLPIFEQGKEDKFINKFDTLLTSFQDNARLDCIHKNTPHQVLSIIF